MGTYSLVLTALSDAYLQVGVWVAVMVWLCGWLRGRPNGQFSRLLADRRFSPWIGALLGVTPGCGGAIVVMPLFTTGSTSFGAVVATLIATMGDSSFVMLAAEPRLGLLIHLGLFVLGGLCGMIVDALKLAPLPRSIAEPRGMAPGRKRGAFSVGAMQVNYGLFSRPDSRGQRITLVIFWAWIAIGLLATIFVSFFRVDPGKFGRIGDFSAFELFGATGAMQCLALAALHLFRRPSHRCVYATDCRGLFVESAHESSPVVFWVALSFIATAILVDVMDIDLSVLGAHELWTVLVGAVVGLIPGCGPQIVLTGLFIEGIVGLPVLLANAVSQDGDALLPLIAKDPRAASHATLMTTLPALVVGALAWFWCR